MATAWRIIAVLMVNTRILFVSGHPDLMDMSKCNLPLGMESGAIPDKDITASSTHGSNVAPHLGRLNHEVSGGAWCPRGMVSKDSKEYIEINLQTLHSVTAVQTQGRYGGGQGVEYAPEYWIEYWRPEIGKWVIWRNRTGHQIITGNTNNTRKVVKHKFDPFILAQKIRINPYSIYGRTICMRVEIIGCLWKLGLVSYSMHQGVSRGSEVDLSDRTYDGLVEGGRLIGGLGQLTDGQRGADNYRADAFGYGKGYEWVGWRNDTIGVTGRYVEIVFEFSEVRNFTLMLLHTNNMYTKHVQVFQYVKAFFSIGGAQFDGQPVQYSYMPDTVLEQARDVIVKLHNRVGKYIRLHLYFAARWIMISEINFDSVPAIGNFTEEEYTATAISRGNSAVSTGDTFQRDEVNTPPGKTYLGIGGNIVTNDKTSPANQDDSLPETAVQAICIASLVAIVFILTLAIAIVARNGKNNPTQPPITFPNTAPSDGRNISNFIDVNSTYTLPYQPSQRRGRPPSTGERVTPCISEHDRISMEGMPPRRLFPPIYANRRPSLREAPTCAPPVPPPPEEYYASIEIDLSSSPPPKVPPITAQTVKTLQTGNKTTINLVPSLSSTSGVGDSSPNGDDDFEVVGVVSFPWKHLKVVKNFEEGIFGPINLCTIVGTSPNTKCSTGNIVAVHSLRPGSTPTARAVFDRYVKTLSTLKDPNVGEVFGIYRDSEPFNVVLEYLPFGNLYELLQTRVSESAVPLSRQTLSYGCLIYMAKQISSGMQYLESQKFVHKDLATRNCMVGQDYLIKVSDLGIGKTLYPADYCILAGKELPMPFRWMSWEYALMEKSSTKSDVWSFAVTLWEILTFAREQPFEELTDHQVMINYTHYKNFNNKHKILAKPIKCSKEIYVLMCECWSRNMADRPNFGEIHLFLQRKNLGYNPEMH